MSYRRTHTLLAIAIFLIVACTVSVGRPRALATPVFAQAYGLGCTACHTQMPMLNAFGRYIQRTGYAAMNPKALSHAVPVFLFDAGTTYTHQSGQPPSDNRITGPAHITLLQANGALGPDLTYKIEHYLTVAGNAGFLDEGWIGYHNILNHSGHLFVGKLAALNLDEFGGPTVLYDVNEAGQGSVPDIAVGVHDYESDYGLGRWGTKFSLVRGKTLAQIAYLANPTGFSSFGDAYDFSRASNTSLQWKVAYADPAKPYELGVFGETGALGFTGSELLPGSQRDNYTVIAPYIQKDPRSGSPGFRLEYSTATDSNPGTLKPAGASNALRPAGATQSSWMIGSVYQMVLHDHGMLNFTYFHTNPKFAQTGLTGLIQPTGPSTGGGPGFSYAINPYTRVYTSAYVAQNQRPTFAIHIWFTPPLWSRLK